MTHQKIRPQTKMPTISAATTEPIHRSYIRFDCSVMPFCGQPKPSTWLPTSQPERSSNSEPATPSTANRTAVGRAFERFADTLCPAPLAPAVTDGRTLLDQGPLTVPGVGVPHRDTV